MFNILIKKVDAQKFPVLGNWNKKNTIETILVALKGEMTSGANKKLAQPAEGTTYWFLIKN